MPLPRIGLNLNVTDTRKPPFGTASVGLAYLDAISRAGGMPVPVPPLEDVSQICEALDGLQGFCFVGGQDYLPYHYGGRAQRTEELMDERRDRFDCALGRTVLRMAKLPVLGICGGCQLIAITMNGALVQDLCKDWTPVGLEKTLPHPKDERSGGDGYDYRHTLRVEQGSLLARVTGTASGGLATNSFHHQAVRPDQPGDGLRITAWAPDGVPESVEPAPDSPFAKEGRFVLGVQWHPERMPFDEPQQRLFKALVDEAGRA